MQPHLLAVLIVGVTPAATVVIGIDFGSRFLKVCSAFSLHLTQVAWLLNLNCINPYRSASSSLAQALSSCLMRPPNASHHPRQDSTHRCCRTCCRCSQPAGHNHNHNPLGAG